MTAFHPVDDVAASFLDWGVSKLPLSLLFPSLCERVLGAFSTTGGMLIGVSDDLSLNILAHYGFHDSALPLPDRPYRDPESPFSLAIRGEVVASSPSAFAWLLVNPGATVLLVPVMWRGSVLAIAVFVMNDPPALEETRNLWTLMGKGLSLVVLREHSPTTSGERMGMRQFPSVTERQREILRLVEAGLTNREIVQRMFLGVSTIGHELVTASRLLGVNSRQDAVREAYRQGVLDIPDETGADQPMTRPIPIRPREG